MPWATSSEPVEQNLMVSPDWQQHTRPLDIFFSVLVPSSSVHSRFKLSHTNGLVRLVIVICSLSCTNNFFDRVRYRTRRREEKIKLIERRIWRTRRIRKKLIERRIRKGENKRFSVQRSRDFAFSFFLFFLFSENSQRLATIREYLSCLENIYIYMEYNTSNFQK